MMFGSFLSLFYQIMRKCVNDVRRLSLWLSIHNIFNNLDLESEEWGDAQ